VRPTLPKIREITQQNVAGCRVASCYQSRPQRWLSAPGQPKENSRSLRRRPCDKARHPFRDTTAPRYTTSQPKASSQSGLALHPSFGETCTESEPSRRARPTPAMRWQSTAEDGAVRRGHGPLPPATRNHVTAIANSTPYPGARRTESRPARRIVPLDDRASGTLPKQLCTPEATSYSQPVLLCVLSKAIRGKRPYFMLYFRKTSVESWVCG
jgi:hypothetical protein